MGPANHHWYQQKFAQLGFELSQQKEDGLSIHAEMQEHSVLYYLEPEFSTNDYKEAKPFSDVNPFDWVAIAENNNWLGYFGSPRLSDLSYGERTCKGLQIIY